MTEQRRTALKELQQLDLQIQEARQRIHDFDPRFAEVEEPALILESELGTSRTRLKEMKLESRRLETATVEKRERQKKLEERIGSVRNLREEAAVSAELEMVKRALQQDEQEAFTLSDQVRKVEDRVGELETALAEATAVVEPKKHELLEQRTEAERRLDSLQTDRASFAKGMAPGELRMYDAIRSGGRRVAVAELTQDGACGNCFGMVPLQLQNEIRHGAALIRCEGCGVILAAPEAADVEPPAAKAKPAPAVDEGDSADAADDADEDEGAPVGSDADEGSL
jgi:predicted  nucleic acid-binding Zn-ribbon protein